MGGKGERVYRNNYKGHMEKTKGGWNQGREEGMAGVSGLSLIHISEPTRPKR